MLANPVAMLAAVCTADTFYNFGAEKPLERYARLEGDSLTKISKIYMATHCGKSLSRPCKTARILGQRR